MARKFLFESLEAYVRGYKPRNWQEYISFAVFQVWWLVFALIESWTEPFRFILTTSGIRGGQMRTRTYIHRRHRMVKMKKVKKSRPLIPLGGR